MRKKKKALGGWKELIVGEKKGGIEMLLWAETQTRKDKDKKNAQKKWDATKLETGPIYHTQTYAKDQEKKKREGNSHG